MKKKGLIQVRNEYSPQQYKFLYNCKLKQGTALIIYMALRGWGAGGLFLKPSTHLSFIKTYQMSLISAGFISQDSTFEEYNSKL
jgi:hypothetical protein